jgi:hypothetical protein
MEVVTTQKTTNNSGKQLRRGFEGTLLANENYVGNL